MKKIHDLIGRYKTFLVVGHYNPDGDCIGSTLAMTLFLKSIGKDVTLYNKDDIPNAFKFISGTDLYTKTFEHKNYDVLIMIDTGEKNRVHPDFDKFTSYQHMICVDHHVTTRTDLFDFSYIKPDASSSGELVFDISAFPKFELTKDIAECVYVAIMTDTGSFKYSNTTVTCFETAAKLMLAGANPKKIADIVYRSVPISRVKLFQRALDSVEFMNDDKIAFMYLYLKDYEETGATSDLSEEFINELLAVNTVEVAVLVKEREKGSVYKVSLRSREKVDVAQICHSHGGGGHRLAAGATFHLSASEIKATLIKDILERL
jgi:phosphoesterase RecJ-like protein